MLEAKKGNKVITVDDSNREHYVNDGFTIYENGKAIEYGKGASVPMADHMKVVEELEALKAELEAVKTKKSEPKVTKTKSKK